MRRTIVVVAACAAALGGAASPGAAPPDAGPGRALFMARQCGGCHLPEGEPGPGPALERLRRPQGAMHLAGRLWNHVPAMFAALSERRVEWPRITAPEMAELMAYLQADPARDPAPDPARGHVILVRKGCLKCHQFRREGGRLEPDLAEARADYESAVVWAAAMWAHTPAMAAMATRQGLAYPRFTGDEMGNLVGYLRQAAGPRRPAASPRPASSPRSTR